MKLKKNIKAPWWDKAINHLSKNDRILKNIIVKHNKGYLKSRGDPFTAICRTIIGQQISVKAASSIFERFQSKVEIVNYKNVLKFNIDEIKNCGLSYKKSEYINSLAQYFSKNTNILDSWEKMNDDLVKKELCKLNGIGPWSAEMFLMFCLLRPNILPLGDLGLRKAIGIHYFNKKNPSYDEIKNIASKWNPYSSAATWYLWRSIDPVPVEY